MILDNWILYFQYLCELIALDRKKEYENIVRMLFSKNFFWSVQYDVNRAYDGMTWRNSFNVNTPYELELHDYDGRPPKVLEVLIGIADRLSYIIHDPAIEIEPSLPRSFWMLIDNLNLRPNDVDNAEKVDRWLKREYDFNGTGGIFPLTEWVPKDQRKVELWYQMMNWVEENNYV